MYGGVRPCKPSRFLGEMDSRLLQIYAKPRPSQLTGYSRGSAKAVGYGAGNTAVRQNNASASEFTEGMRVRHKKFGEGTVVGITDVGKNSYLVINFDSIGKITLSLAFAPIEKV